MKLKDWINKIEGEQLSEMAATKPIAIVDPNKKTIGTGTFTSTDPKSSELLNKMIDTIGPNKFQFTQTSQSTPPAGATGQQQSMAMTEEELEEVAPPGMEDVVLALKKKFPGQEGRAYAIAWSQYNKKHPKKSNESVEELRESMEHSTMNEALKQILDAHPHEHKMCQEGWGMDESLYEALCDHYYREGRIPRKIWHGPLDELRGHVEECYAKDTGMLLGEDEGMLEENPLAAVGSVLGTVARAAAPAVGMAVGNKVADKIEQMENVTIAAPDEELVTEDDIEEGLRGKLAALGTAAALGVGGHSMLKDPAVDHPTINAIEMQLKKEDDPFKRREIERDLKRTKDSISLDRGVPSDILTKYQFKMRDDRPELTKEDSLERMLRKSTEMDETMNESKFSKLKGKLKKKGAKDPAALAAWIGREKLGQKEMTRRSVAGRKRADEDLDSVTQGVAEGIKKTEKGIVHKAEPGGYGRKYDTDEEGNEKDTEKTAKREEPKRGRGRPKKVGGDADRQEKYAGAKGLQDYIVGNLPGGKLPGKPGKKHKLSDKEASKSKKKTVKEDAQIALWHQQLGTLLKEGVVKEGLTVSTSVGQEGGHDSVSITASDDDAHQLLQLLQNAGVGSGVPGHAIAAKAAPATVLPNTGQPTVGSIAVTDGQPNPSAQKDIDGAAGSVPIMAMPRGMVFSVNDETEMPTEPEDCETADHDSVMTALSSEHKDGQDDGSESLAAIKRLMGAHGAGEVSVSETETQDHDDEPVNEEDLEEGNGYLKARLDAIKAGKSSFEFGGKTHKVTGDTSDERKEKVDEEDIGQSAEEDRAAEEEGEAEAEAESSNKMAEGVEHCEDCGGKLEEGHQCESKVEESQELREWANSPAGRSEEEQFTADIDFMTKMISGGLNGPKSTGQTTVPVISSQLSRQITKEGSDNSIVFDMKKLAGIR